MYQVNCTFPQFDSDYFIVDKEEHVYYYITPDSDAKQSETNVTQCISEKKPTYMNYNNGINFI